MIFSCRTRLGFLVLMFRLLSPAPLFGLERVRITYLCLKICFPPVNASTRVNVAEEIGRSFLDYSMSVIISRALPDVRDGLKPSQRRILYAMHELGLLPGRSTSKCAGIVGETMKKFHPHGDQAIYPTLVHMAEPWSMRERLIEGKGNFGSVEGDAPAAMRYTEARLTHLGAILMEDIDKDTVDFQPILRREEHGAGGAPGGVPESAGQRRHGHRGRHGDQSRAA